MSEPASPQELEEGVDEVLSLVEVVGMATKAYEIDDGVFFDGAALYRFVELVEKRVSEISWGIDAMRRKGKPHAD